MGLINRSPVTYSGIPENLGFLLISVVFVVESMRGLFPSITHAWVLWIHQYSIPLFILGFSLLYAVKWLSWKRYFLFFGLLIAGLFIYFKFFG